MELLIGMGGGVWLIGLPVVAGNEERNQRNHIPMQDKSEKHIEFSERTEELARAMGILLSDLPGEIRVSPSMFYAYRTGKKPISEKAWRKLSAAEKRAGIAALPWSADDPAVVKEEPLVYGTKAASEPLRAPGEPTILERLDAMEREREETKATLAAIKKSLDDLTDLFTNRKPKD